MAVNLPTPINLHNTSPDNDELDLENIGNTSRGLKNAGNLPMTTSAAEVNHSGSGVVKGTAYEMPQAFDSTSDTKVLVWAWQFNAPNRIQVDTKANNGVVARLYSSIGNYIQFRIGGNDTPAASSQAGPLPFVLDPKASGFTDEVGTFDTSTVMGYGWGSSYKALTGQQSSLAFFTRAFLFDTTKDAAAIPKFTGSSHFDDIIAAVLGTNYTNKIHIFVSKAGSTYTLLCPFQIGDGATSTNFNDNGATVLSPADNDVSDPRFHLSDQAMRVYLSLTSSDSVTLSGTYVWGTAADWDCNSNANASVTLSGTFKGMGNISLGPDVTATGSFDLANGKQVIDYGAVLSGIIVNGFLRLSSRRNLTSVSAGRIVLTVSGEYTLTNCQIDEVENISGGAVSISLVGTEQPTAIETDGTVSFPQFLTVTDIESDDFRLIAWDASDIAAGPIFNYANGSSHTVNLTGITTVRLAVNKPGHYARIYDLTTSELSETFVVVMTASPSVDVNVDIDDLVAATSMALATDPYGQGRDVLRATISGNFTDITPAQWRRFHDYFSDLEEGLSLLGENDLDGDEVYKTTPSGIVILRPVIEVYASGQNHVSTQAFVDESPAQAIHATYDYTPRNADNVSVEAVSVEPLVDYGRIVENITDALGPDIRLSRDHARAANLQTQPK